MNTRKRMYHGGTYNRWQFGWHAYLVGRFGGAVVLPAELKRIGQQTGHGGAFLHGFFDGCFLVQEESGEQLGCQRRLGDGELLTQALEGPRTHSTCV